MKNAHSGECAKECLSVVLGGIARVVFGAQRIGIKGVRLDVRDDLLKFGGHLVGTFDVPEDLRLVRTGDVDIAHVQTLVDKPDFEIYVFDIGIIDVVHVDSDYAAPDNDAGVGEGVFHIFVLAVCGQDIAHPNPHRQKVKEQEHTDKHDKHCGNLRKDIQPDHESDERAVEAQPDNRDGEHLQDARPNEGGLFRLAPPEKLFALREYVLDGVVLHAVAFLKVIFPKICHFVSLLFLS